MPPDKSAGGLDPALASALRFSTSAFDRLFPFHLLMDQWLTVTRAGPVLLRILPGLVPPSPFIHHFTVRRPSSVGLTFEALGEEPNTIFLLEARARPELMLKGQIIRLDDSGMLLFLGSPWITSLDQLGGLDLSAPDFAIHDSITDFLVLIQAQKTALDDASKLAADLRTARDAAVQASRVKSEFLAKMSHELRTPLNAIIGFSEAIHSAIFGPLADRYKTYAGHIHSSGRMLLELINDLLDLSRIESGRYEIVEEPVGVAGALHDCIHLVSEGAERKQLEINLTCEPPDLTMRLDARAFGQVFLNLLSNAVKFTPRGFIDVEARRGERDVAITVKDSGIGITAESLPHLFEPFRQANPRISQQYGGSGLGLSISRNLVELHGGTVTIESRSGEGTTVIVRLPAERIIGA